MITREDVVRITEQVLRDLTIEVEDGHWTSPNERSIILKYKDAVITRASFDVVQKREYEG